MVRSKCKVGLFGGTFNPIHFGHLNLALEMLEKIPLDQIWFIPTQLNPFKEEVITPLTDSEDRAEMVLRAIQDIPQFSLNTIEMERPAPSYTFDTAKILTERYQAEIDFYLLVGSDIIPQLHSWYSIEKLLSLVTLKIAVRSLLKEPQNIPIVMKNFPILQTTILQASVETKLMDISSTEIRSRLKRGAYCGHLVPQSVLEYIKNHHLFS